MTAWAHLPNATVIDTLIADGKSRPEVWADAWVTVAACSGERVWGDAWAAARRAAESAARGGAHITVYAQVDHTLPFEIKVRVQFIVQDTLLTLIAWPSSADMLTLTPDALRTIIDTCDGDVKHQAVLLLPAAIARSTS